MKKGILVIIVIICVILFGYILQYDIKIKAEKIIERFDNINLKVKKINQQFTIINSPFYYVNKGQYIYKVELENGEIWWVRTGFVTDDYIKQ
jgi:hypothetical protein